MKKKRHAKVGHKKGKQKIIILENESASALDGTNMEDGFDSDENDELLDSKLEIESPTSLGDRSRNSISLDVDLPSKDPALKFGSGRVKVKLKSLRPLGPQCTHSDVQSETEVSQPKEDAKGQKLYTENKEDSTYSDGPTSDLQQTFKKSPRKSGSITIISSRGMEKHLKKQTNSLLIFDERGIISSDNEKTADSTIPEKVYQNETGTKSRYQDSSDNQRELNDALEVIKKVMKMEAAEPFNAPVDPVALGIPDYFDVIDTPMDFGTICNNLEHEKKYLSSEDVLKDVQIIWDNCSKYNNKGDYVIDLMKRVKKGFAKYWLAAGLYWEVPAGAADTAHADENRQSNQEKLHTKGKISKYKRRRLGTNHHKSGCLCAVCVIRRQKKEKEGNIVSQMEVSDGNAFNEQNMQEDSPIDNRNSEHSSTSLSQSPARRFIVDAGNELGETDESQFIHSQLAETIGFEQNRLERDNKAALGAPQLILAEDRQADNSQPSQGLYEYRDYELGNADYKHDAKDEAGVLEDKKQTEMQRSSDRMELYQDPLHEENHSISQICKTIFSKNQKSVWNEGHSLRNLFQVSSLGNSPIHSAISTFFKN